nr:hypothetical protein [Sinorhizobium saheli]
MMRAETYAVVNLAALNLIEAASAAYFVTERETAARHEFRAREMLRKIAQALGYEITEVDWREKLPAHVSAEALPQPASPSLRLVSAKSTD